VSSVSSERLGELPEPLPLGEQLLWQGTSHWRTLARRVFRVRILAVYFAVILASRAAWAMTTGSSLEQALLSALWLLPLVVAALGLLVLLAWLMNRTTLYAVTDRRVIMRIGVALPMTVNIPFGIIQSAGLKTYADGSGDLPLSLSGSDRIAYVHLWPHVRPWRFTCTEPMLRAIPEAARVGAILADALAAFAKTTARLELVKSGASKEAPVLAAEAQPLAAAAR
jgi:hypothetical protein